MIKLLKQMKKKTWAILFIIILLIIQAMSDLSLPDYTSKIINIGIQQSGIETTTYKKISKETFSDFLVLSTSIEKEKLKDSYTLEEDTYVLIKDKDINKVTDKKTLLRALTNENSKELKDVTNKVKEEFPEELRKMSLLEIIYLVDDTTRERLVLSLEKYFEEVPEIFSNSLVIEMIKQEYKLVGIDISKMQTEYVITSGLKMLGIALISMVATISVGLIGSIISASFAKDVRTNIYKTTTDYSTTEMRKIGVSSLITRTTNDVQQVQQVMVFMLRIMFYAPIVGIGGVLKAIQVNKEMASIILVVMLIVLAIGVLVIFVAMPKIKLIQTLVDKLSLVTREMLNGIQVIRAFGNQKFEEDKFKDTSNEIKKNYMFVNSFFSVLQPVLMLIMNGIAIVIIYKAAHQINNGNMQVGDMLAFIQYVMQIVMAFVMISVFAIRIPRASVSAKRINEVLDTENSIKDPEKAKTFTKRKKGEIEFKDVSFKYFDSDENVLSDISFKIEPGSTTAFIGSTGSGKSTLVSLIPRLFDATKGEVLVNGLNVKDVKQKDLHEKISFIFQEGVLFSGTIKENIDFSNKNLSTKKIKDAAKISQAAEFINKKDKKYDDLISQGGTNVSGGQKQRLSIARAIAKDSDIYIFDDSFSALDFKTDQLLRKAIKENLYDKTILIVSQRVSTIMDADKIVVLDEGHVVGEGTHKELVKNNEIYKEIALSQLSEKEL